MCVLCGCGIQAGRASALLELLDYPREYIELKGDTRDGRPAGFPIVVGDRL